MLSRLPGIVALCLVFPLSAGADVVVATPKGGGEPRVIARNVYVYEANDFNLYQTVSYFDWDVKVDVLRTHWYSGQGSEVVTVIRDAPPAREALLQSILSRGVSAGKQARMKNPADRDV